MTSDGRTIATTDIVLVVGPMRTGTTLVARLLDTHPDVAYLGFELAEEWAEWTGLPWGAPGADDVACPPYGAEAATPERIASVRSGLAGLVRRRTDGGTWPGTVVLKSPHFWHRLPLLCALLPRTRIVRTRRGLLPTVASLRRLWDRSLEQHDRVHHLPLDPGRCWDFVPAADADDLDPARTFPGGDVRVLAEFCRRVESELDAFASSHPGRMATELHQESVVSDFDVMTRHLQRALRLPVVELTPPHPLDPGRNEEWRTLLSETEQRLIRQDVAPDPRRRPRRRRSGGARNA